MNKIEFFAGKHVKNARQESRSMGAVLLLITFALLFGLAYFILRASQHIFCMIKSDERF